VVQSGVIWCSVLQHIAACCSVLLEALLFYIRDVLGELVSPEENGLVERILV